MSGVWARKSNVPAVVDLYVGPAGPFVVLVEPDVDVEPEPVELDDPPFMNSLSLAVSVSPTLPLIAKLAANAPDAEAPRQRNATRIRGFTMTRRVARG